VGAAQRLTKTKPKDADATKPQPQENQYVNQIIDGFKAVNTRLDNIENNHNSFVTHMETKVNSVIQEHNKMLNGAAPATENATGGDGLANKTLSQLKVNDIIGLVIDSARELKQLGIIGKPAIDPAQSASLQEAIQIRNAIRSRVVDELGKKLGTEIGTNQKDNSHGVG
jgi:hypothetical protein